MQAAPPVSSNGTYSTLPGDYYHSAAIFQQELERIFFAMWICAGRADAIPAPGDYFLRQLGNESVIVTRDKRGQIRAFYNVCRHRGARLCTEGSGQLRGQVITCPYHRWSYALSGELIATPNLAADEIDRTAYGLHEIDLQLYAGFIYLRLTTNDQPLDEPLGGFEAQAAPYRLDELQVARTVAYDVEANWKIVVENFMECYHCPGVHPELCAVVPDFRRALVHQGQAGGARLAEGATTLTMTGHSNRPPIGDLTPEDVAIYRSKTRYPNMFLSFHSDYVLIHTLWPQGPQRTHVICDWLFEPATIARADFDPTDAVDMWDLVNRQDWDMCELTQQGVSSRSYTHGVYGTREHLLHHFNEFVRRSLAG
jgi:Rieske 2Fe-2S family protein